MSRYRYAVLGLGQFGHALALELTELGCEVLAVDRDRDRVDAIQQHVAASAVADVSNREALKELCDRTLDGVIVAIGGSLESAILATLALKEIGVARILAEAATPDRAEVLKRVGATDVLSPERAMGKVWARRLAAPNLLDFIPIAEGHSVLEVDAPSDYAGKTLAELDLRRSRGVAVVAIRRLEGHVSVAPGGDARIQAGDRLVVLGDDDTLAAYQKRNG